VGELAKELARVQEQLRGVSHPEAMLAGIFAFAPFAVQVYRADGVSIVVNRAFREIFGSEPPPEYNILRDEVLDRGGQLEHVKRAFAGERVFVPAVWYDARDVEHVKVERGRRVAVEATFFPLFDADEKISHVAIVFKDVTVEMQAKEAADRIARLHAIAGRLVGATTPRDVADVVLDHGVSALGVRRMVLGVLSTDGVTVEILSDRGFGTQEYRHHSFALDARVPLADAIRTGEAIFFEDSAAFERAYPDVATAAKALELGPLGAVPLVTGGRGIGGIGFDFPKGAAFGTTERTYLGAIASLAAQALDRARLFRQTQEAVLRAEEAVSQAEEASRAKDEFLSVLSHELRTPLNAIQGWAHLAATRGREDPEFLERAVDVILRNVRAQVTLVDDMLDVARIIRGKLRLSLAAFRLREVVDAAVDAVRPMATAKGITLVVEVPTSIRLVADADRTQQIVWNLISNAIKFTGKAGRVHVVASTIDGVLRLTVTDDGIGIAAHDLPFVFDRFRQVDSSTTRTKGGLGLGLAIVRHLTEAHGGTATVASEGKGHGATFVIELPGIEDPEKVPAPASSSALADDDQRPTPVSPSSANGLSGTRILVVDDEADSAELLAFVLEERGAVVKTARGAREALDVANTFAPQVLVTDIAMPDEDGFALLRALRARPAFASIPAVALTAFARADDVEATRASGFEWHVSKPVDPREVVRVAGDAAAAARKAESDG
jgi:signal transduction histidine kinase/ActR/RegA family two-component response regulator